MRRSREHLHNLLTDTHIQFIFVHARPHESIRTIILVDLWVSTKLTRRLAVEAQRRARRLAVYELVFQPWQPTLDESREALQIRSPEGVLLLRLFFLGRKHGKRRLRTRIDHLQPEVLRVIHVERVVFELASVS